MQIGRKVYYEKATGNIVFITSEMQGDVIETTTEQDFESYQILNERVPSSVGCIKLEYGEYSQDFHQCNGLNVNLETGLLEFSYPDSNNETPIEPVYKPPLSYEVTTLKSQLEAVQAVLDDILMNGLPI